MMSVYVEVQTEINKRRIQEMDENQKKLEAETAAIQAPSSEAIPAATAAVL